jgi:hypothetical protein
MLYRVKWVNEMTGAQGHGLFIFTYEQALHIANQANLDYGEGGFFHFVENENLYVHPPVQKKFRFSGVWGGA